MHLFTGFNKFDIKNSQIIQVKDNKYSVDFGLGRRFYLTVYENENTVHFKVTLNKVSSLYLIGEIGVDVEFNEDFKSVSWIRNSLYSDYPESHIARDCGTAFKDGAVHNYDDMDMRNISWEQDMSAFAYYRKARGYLNPASNDFRTKRLKIKQYLVDMISENKVLVNADSQNINAYANPFNNKLQISKGYYKQSTLWGNYWGRRFILNKQNSFEFSATFENQK